MFKFIYDPKIQLIAINLAIIILYFLGSYIFGRVVSKLYYEKSHGKYGYFIIKLSVIYHECSHLLGILVSDIFALVFIIIPPIAKLFFSIPTGISFKDDPKDGSMGKVSFGAGFIGIMIISVMPFLLMPLSFIGLLKIWDLPVIYKLIFVLPYVVFVLIPCAIGSFPSFDDVANLFLLPIFLVIYFVYLWNFPMDIKLYFSFAVPLLIIMSAAILIKLAILLTIKLSIRKEANNGC